MPVQKIHIGGGGAAFVSGLTTGLMKAMDERRAREAENRKFTMELQQAIAMKTLETGMQLDFQKKLYEYKIGLEKVDTDWNHSVNVPYNSARKLIGVTIQDANTLGLFDQITPKVFKVLAGDDPAGFVARFQGIPEKEQAKYLTGLMGHYKEAERLSADELAKMDILTFARMEEMGASESDFGRAKAKADAAQQYLEKSKPVASTRDEVVLTSPDKGKKASVQVGSPLYTQLTEKENWTVGEEITERTSALQEKIDVIRRARPDWSYQKVVEEATNIKEPAGKTYLLDDQTTVMSFDGGRTYSGADGKTHKMPYNAVEVETRVTGEELTGFRQEKAAAEELAKPSAPPGGALKTPEEAAKGGTGPYRKLGAVIDAIAGGFFGLDAFPDTQENRQQLRVLKQMGRSVLSKSARGAQWEMKQIDALFPDPDKAIRNPDSEAQKIRILRETLLTEKRFNLEAIAGPTSAKEKGDLRKVNMEMDRLLALLGPETKPTTAPALTPERERLMDLYAPR